MMKVSDPIIFGHAVKVYFKSAFEKHGATLAGLGANPNLGLANVLSKVAEMEDSSLRAEIEADFAACYSGRKLAMVDSRNGITNLHVPNDVIIDASMPPMVRDGGKMWNAADELEDTVAIIPDRCYAGIYKEMVADCKVNGQYDVTTMGNVANVGLMAQKAQEYGSHPNTFEMKEAGVVKVTDAAGHTVFESAVEAGDIWRMCQTKDEPIRDWVKLAVSRARATGDATIFWLNPERSHDRVLIELIEIYLKDFDITGLDISIQSPVDAMRATCARVRAGKNTISVTGNVLRDYLTDLFPILELGTSAKMLSIVPLLAGGGLFETGAGGSAPKHVQQFVKEGHLRWDSLGEYLAIAVSLEHLGNTANMPDAKLLGDTLNEAVGELLLNSRSPSRKVNEVDNRASSFYIALYWAQAMAAHNSKYTALAEALAANEESIVQEMIDCQGAPVNTGGYFKPNDALTSASMRPSATFNGLIDNM